MKSRVVKIIKNYQSKIINYCVVLALFFVGCDNSAIYQDEHYKTLVYLLSGEDNVFSASYSLNEPESARYVTIGCGGSNANEKEIVVTLEPNPQMLDRYNRQKYNYAHRYAKLLPTHMYDVESYTVALPANSNEHYARMPVRVRPLGLSPDTMYFIPLKIMSVSEYEVNEAKQDVLFRVAIENDYARQIVPTYYTKSGVMTDPPTVLSGPRRVHPLSTNRIRMFVGNLPSYDEETTTVEDIERHSIIVEIQADNSVRILPHPGGAIQAQQIAKEGYNRYDPARVFGGTTQRVFYLSYSFRLMNPNGTFPDAWRNVEEILIRVED